MDPNVPDIDTSIDTLIKLSEIVGRQRVAWRYDPVLLTEKYTVEKHFETFGYMAKRLAPYIDRCIFSFVETYKKLQRNMPELIQLTEADKFRLAEGLGAIAGKYGVRIQTCGTNGDYTKYGIHASGCATLEILGKANGCEFKDIKHKGLREGCHCIESRDVGAYDSCPNGCRYCYANNDMARVKQNYKNHNPKSPLLIGELQPTDAVIQGNQKSFLVSSASQFSIFDE